MNENNDDKKKPEEKPELDEKDLDKVAGGRDLPVPTPPMPPDPR